MVRWGDFQVLIHISIALNTAVAALSDFFGSASREESNRARALANRARELKANDPDHLNHPKYDSIIADFIILEGRSKDIYEIYPKFIHRYIMPCCIIFTTVSILMLVASSYLYDKPMGYLFQGITLVSMAPFIVGLVEVVLLSARGRGISKGIQELYADLLDVERTIYGNSMKEQ
jgi:hypothetical protein